MIRDYLHVIGHSHFRNLLLGQIVSQVSLNMLSFVLAIRIYQETKSNTAVSLMLLSFGIPAILFGVLAGGVVDYFDKRRVMQFCNLSRVGIIILFFFLHKSLLVVYLLSVLVSVVTQLFIPAEAPSIPTLVKRNNLLSANSLFTISFYLATITGFILAGPAIKLMGPKNVYLFIAGLMGTAFLFVSRLPAMEATRKNEKFAYNLPFFFSVIRDGIRFIQSNLRVGQSLVLLTIAQALVATLSVLAPGFADRILRIDLSDASFVVMGPAALGLIIGALWVGAVGKQFLKRKLIILGIIATSVTLLLLSILSMIQVVPRWGISGPGFYWGGVGVAMGLLLLLGFSNSFITVPTSTVLQQESESQMRGRVYGVLTSLTGGVSVLPVVFSGVLADSVGIDKTLFVIGTIILVIGIAHMKDIYPSHMKRL